MTNREMVKDPRPGGPKLPEPNVPKPGAPVPAPEDDPYLLTTDDPVDSPQPHPELNPRPKPRVLGGSQALDAPVIPNDEDTGTAKRRHVFRRTQRSLRQRPLALQIVRHDHAERRHE